MSERIRWDDDEKARIERAALPLLLANPKMLLIDAVRAVQDTVLPEPRRRSLVNIGSIPVELRQSLELRRKAASGDATMIPADDLKKLQEAYDVEARRVQELLGQVAERDDTINSLNAELRTYRMAPKPPTEGEVVKRFLADVVADALARGRAVPGPTTEQINTVVATAKPPAKHDPAPMESGPRKPKIAFIGGDPGIHKKVHEAVGELAEMRYFGFDNTNQAGWSERLKAFKDDAYFGRVIFFSEISSHVMMAGLKLHNIPHVVSNAKGNTALVEAVKFQIAALERRGK